MPHPENSISSAVFMCGVWQCNELVPELFFFVLPLSLTLGFAENMFHDIRLIDNMNKVSDIRLKVK
jgi:hypothetical protein